MLPPRIASEAIHLALVLVSFVIDYSVIALSIYLLISTWRANACKSLKL